MDYTKPSRSFHPPGASDYDILFTSVEEIVDKEYDREFKKKWVPDIFPEQVKHDGG